MAKSYETETEISSRELWSDEYYEPSPDDWEAIREQQLLVEIESARKETKIKAWELLSDYIETLQQGGVTQWD